MTAPITRQDIVDRRETLGKKKSAAYEREMQLIAAEQRALEELCGGMGHLFMKANGLFAFSGRNCIYCYAQAAKAQ